MKYTDKGAENVKIAYIGGGSRGWAWGLMSDLAVAGDMSGDVYLYDIDYGAALDNEIIGNKFNSVEGCISKWNYKAAKTIDEALSGADFVVISILPGTFEEMESDVHTPEKYGIYQSVGDTAGPGGIIRALRTLPMMEVIARAVQKNCPNAWVINYTNPMALCIKSLYDTFPEIKAFGCCHEVFAVQKLFGEALEEIRGIKPKDRSEVSVNVLGTNHFTWINKATYHNIDLMPIYAEYIERHPEGIGEKDANWMNKAFKCMHLVKFDLFKRYGVAAAAGDRHLAEFCEGSWYLKNPEHVDKWGFGLTPVSWRKENLKERLERSRRLREGEEELKIDNTGEEGVMQMRALLGLSNLVTNVNIPNRGQIPNLPLGAVVETNAAFTADTVTPVLAGEIPEGVLALVMRNVDEQLLVAKAVKERNLEYAFRAFVNDPLVTIDTDDAKALFDEMIENTKEYLKDYNL